MIIQQVTYATANEGGLEEIEIGYNQNFIQWLFRKKPTTKKFVKYGGVWWKDGWVRATRKEENDIEIALCRVIWY